MLLHLDCENIKIIKAALKLAEGDSPELISLRHNLDCGINPVYDDVRLSISVAHGGLVFLNLNEPQINHPDTDYSKKRW